MRSWELKIIVYQSLWVFYVFMNWSMNCFLHLVCCCSIWRCTSCFVCVVLASVCHIFCFGFSCNKNFLLTCDFVFFYYFQLYLWKDTCGSWCIIGKIGVGLVFNLLKFPCCIGEAILMYGSSSWARKQVLKMLGSWF